MLWHNLRQKLALELLKNVRIRQITAFFKLRTCSRRYQQNFSSIVQFNFEILNLPPVALNLLCSWWGKIFRVKSKSFQFNFILQRKLSTLSLHISSFCHIQPRRSNKRWSELFGNEKVSSPFFGSRGNEGRKWRERYESCLIFSISKEDFNLRKLEENNWEATKRD
jgi:hypothetical protein